MGRLADGGCKAPWPHLGRLSGISGNHPEHASRASPVWALISIEGYGRGKLLLGMSIPVVAQCSIPYSLLCPGGRAAPNSPPESLPHYVYRCLTCFLVYSSRNGCWRRIG
jgi:hypothetical protein